MENISKLVEEQQKQLEKQMRDMRERMFKIEVEVLDGGKLPTKAHNNDAGFDVYASSDVIIYPGQVIKHPLNVKLKLPVGCWARVETKSGLGSKGMLVYAGVCDEGYRGVIHVIATNLKLKNEDGSDNTSPLIVKKGEKLAQITMNNHANEYFMVQVENISEETSRGTGGFGSSGLI